MLSEHKRLLRVSAVMCAAACVVAPLLMYGVAVTEPVPEPLTIAMLCCMAVAIGAFCLSVCLTDEYTKALMGQAYDVDAPDAPLPPPQYFPVVAWSSPVVQWLGPAALLPLMCLLWFCAKLAIVDGAEQVRCGWLAALNLTSAVLLMSLPVLASASRMPGAFSRHFAPASPVAN